MLNTFTLNFARGQTKQSSACDYSKYTFSTYRPTTGLPVVAFSITAVYIYITLFHQKLVDNKKIREKTLK